MSTDQVNHTWWTLENRFGTDSLGAAAAERSGFVEVILQDLNQPSDSLFGKSVQSLLEYVGELLQLFGGGHRLVYSGVVAAAIWASTYSSEASPTIPPMVAQPDSARAPRTTNAPNTVRIISIRSSD